jgi:cytochrome bd ubiquinol oxidase subunit I
VILPFLAFRLMVGLGLAMLAIAWWGVLLMFFGRIEKTRWFLWATFLSFPAGFIAVLCGWITAEVGRQPWVVYGLLRTSEAVTPSLTGGEAAFSLFAYIAVYAVVYTYGVIYIARLMRGGLDPQTPSNIPAAEGMGVSR